MKPKKLLIPGPVDLDDDVLGIMGRRPVPHYGADWVALYRETIKGLRAIFRTDGDVYPLVGSGSVAVEATIGSFLATGQRLAVVRNGFFGDRIAEIAAAYGIEVVPIEVPWGEAARPELVRRVLEGGPLPDALALVHSETSTGVQNPVREIAAVSAEFRVPVIVDAVSSLGGAELRMDEWGIVLCATATQKALAAPAGFGLVAVSAEGWRHMDANPVKDHGWYLNLRNWRRNAHAWGDWHPQLATIPTGAFSALHLRVQHILDVGLDRYIERHSRACRRFRDGVRSLGLPLLAPDEDASPLVTAVEVAPDFRPPEIVAYLRDNHDLWVSGGLGPLRDRVIRVGHMGKATSEEYVDAVLAGLGAVVRENRGATL